MGIKNWERIRGGNANKLIINSYNNALKEELPWVVKINEHLVTNDLGNLPPNANGKPFIYKKLYDTLSKKFQVDALSSINSPRHKLRTYALMKTEIGLENYLNVINNVSIRTQFSKFRLSDHNLEIEKGRHRGIVAEQRFCPFCKSNVENEIHFLLECPIYKELREADPVFQVDNPGISLEEKFVLLVSKGPDIAPFIHKIFELRNYLLSFPKRSN